MEPQDEAVVSSLKAAVVRLNEALEMAARQGIEVEPQFQEQTSMEHSAPCLVLGIGLTKHLGEV